ncbi:unnamed protein product [Microthlaspi erraticum]|uniref:TMEM205-like domain-containing protein n=1 Tax=Microthlaspi erraticum TaxID=1685480 RepID=A0A6D2IJJ0_9BRAS|nr:unnamed protein product [Microthlaspi erraticum]
MKKLVALFLVLCALLSVSHCSESEGDVIVKDGHRVVVVEYDGDGKTSTRVLISPPGKGGEGVEEKRNDEREVFRDVKKKVMETASSLPVMAQVEEEREHHASPGELICDAIGKCKHKMASVLGRVNNDDVSETPRETVARAARDVEETVAHEAQRTKEKVAGRAQEANERVTKKAQKAQNVWGKSKITVRRIGTAVAEALKLTKVGSVVSLIGIAAAYGMCVWVTIISRYVLTSVLGRQQCGVVQSKVYPVYFKAISVGILVGLLGHVISRRRKVFTVAVEMWQAVNLLCSILMVEANASFVEPRAIKAMFERIKVEKEEGRGLDTSESQASEAAVRTSGKKVRQKTGEGAVNCKLTKLNERLSRLNAYSMRLNLLTLMSLTWHFVYLGHRLSLIY